MSSTPFLRFAAASIWIGIVIGSWSHAATAAPAAAPPADPTSTIYLQRGADGRLVLTDRPSPLVTTERSWQHEREDPVAARQRAADMRREAAAVSERVQRTIDEDERQRASADARASERADQRERDAAIARAADADVPLLVAPVDVFGLPWRARYAAPGYPAGRPGRPNGAPGVRPPRRDPDRADLGTPNRRYGWADPRDRHGPRDPQRQPRARQRSPAAAVDEPTATPGRR